MVLVVLGASALAIALLVLLNVLIGGWASARLTSAEAAEQALAHGVYGFRAQPPVALSADGAGALALEEGGGRLGLAVALGDTITVRALAPGDLKAVRRHGEELTLALNDYTFPTARLRFADAEHAQRWQATAEEYLAAPARPTAFESRHA